MEVEVGRGMGIKATLPAGKTSAIKLLLYDVCLAGECRALDDFLPTLRSGRLFIPK